MAKKATAKTKEVEVTIIRPKRNTIRVRIECNSPLICHRFSDTAKKEMLEKHTRKPGEAKPDKKPRDTQQEFLESLYPIPDEPGKYGFPAGGIKNSVVRACGSKSINRDMTAARAMFFVESNAPGDLVRIEGSKPHSCEHNVRIGKKIAYVRYRGMFDEWAMEFDVLFNENDVSLDELLSLFDLAGFGVGIGDWRPEKSGRYGMFHVEPPKKQAST